MKREPTPEELRWLKTALSPERLRKNLRRVNLLIPIETIALGLCIASLCIEGHNTLLVALTGLLTIQLLYLAANRHEIKQQIKRIKELMEK